MNGTGPCDQVFKKDRANKPDRHAWLNVYSKITQPKPAPTHAGNTLSFAFQIAPLRASYFSYAYPQGVV